MKLRQLGSVLGKLKLLKNKYGWVGHIFWGYAIVLIASKGAIGLGIAAMMLVVFLLYELDEEWCIGDHAIEELWELMIGMIIGLFATGYLSIRDIELLVKTAEILGGLI